MKADDDDAAGECVFFAHTTVMETKHVSPGLQKLIRSLVETIAHECEVKALLGAAIREHLVTPIYKELFPYAVVVLTAVVVMCLLTLTCLVVLIMR